MYCAWLFRVATVSLVLLLSARGDLRGNEPHVSGTVGHAARGRAARIDPEELEAFLHKFVDERMRDLHIPGAVFVLVQDGKISFKKGYGYANLNGQTPVDPDKTLFWVASVTKLVTATAVMQLVERGLLNVDESVNKYLRDFRLEESRFSPVTVRHLLTHTSGLDGKEIGMAARTAADVMPLGKYVAQRMPRRALPPGDVIMYSNYGYALAGHLVEAVTRESYAQYVRENILTPLEMRHSTIQQPLPRDLLSDLAVGYEFNDNAFQPVRDTFLHDLPAGGLVATGTDMARFMIAHLELGRYGDVRILNQGTALEMHRQQFTQHPRLAGRTFGFNERLAHGVRAIEHGGDLSGYASLLFLLPEERVGFFVACNNDVPRFREELVDAFLDHYYPVAPPPILHPPGGFKNRAAHFAGRYRYNRYARFGLEKLLTPFSEFLVTADSDGALTVRYPAGFGDFRKPFQINEVEPLLFQRSDDAGYVAFRENDRRRVTHMFGSFFGPTVFEKLAWYETATFQAVLLGFFLMVFSLTILAWPIGYLLRRWRGPSSRPMQRWPLARVIAGAVAALNLFFVVTFVLLLLRVLREGAGEFNFGVPPAVVALLYIPLISTVLTLPLPVFAAMVWKRRCWSLPGRVHYTLVAMTAIGFLPFLYYWNLLGFQF